jgi:hypothetical protein
MRENLKRNEEKLCKNRGKVILLRFEKKKEKLKMRNGRTEQGKIGHPPNAKSRGGHLYCQLGYSSILLWVYTSTSSKI